MNPRMWCEHAGRWLMRGDDPDRVVGIATAFIGVLFIAIEIWERL